MLTIYGRRNSANVQVAMWTIHELGLEHRRIDVGIGHASPQEPDYLAKNPMGLVPTLEDGDTTLWESAAIMRYLAASHGDNTFWPSDPRQRAPLDTWAEWGKNTFARAILDIFSDEVRVHPDLRKPEDLDRMSERAAALATILSDHLSSRNHIAGEDFTFADIAVGHILYRYHTLDWPRPTLPVIDAYYARLQERPAFRDHVMVNYDDLRGLYPDPE